MQSSASVNWCNLFSVVIPTKNGGSLFRDVLDGLKSQVVNVPWELIIIDSGSTDGSADLAKSYGAQILKIVPESFNHGTTRNLAIESTKGEIVILLTQDAVPADRYLLEALLRPFADPHVAGSYARQSARADADALTKRALEDWLTGGLISEVRWIENRAHYDAMIPMEKYMFCNFDNVCSAIRKTVWQKIPLRSNQFGEDIDWSKRVLEAGWKIAYEPAAHVIHSHNRTINYEYKRTYMCHRKLYELFALRTIPTRSAAVKCITYQTYRHWRYLLPMKASMTAKIKLLLRIPILAAATVLGQYQGAKDEIFGRGRKQVGV